MKSYADLFGIDESILGDWEDPYPNQKYTNMTASMSFVMICLWDQVSY